MAILSLAYLYATNHVPTGVLENFVAVDQVHVVQLVQFKLELAQARIQRHSVRFEAVNVVFCWIVTLQCTIQQCSTQ